MRKVLVLILIFALSISFVGCSSNEEEIDETIKPENEEEIKEQVELPEDAPDYDDIPTIDEVSAVGLELFDSQEESIYMRVDENGDNIWVQEGSPQVAKLQAAVTKFAEAFENIDYKTADGWEAYEFLTEAEKVKYKDVDKGNEVAMDFFTSFEIVKYLSDIRYNYVIFESEDRAILDCDFGFVYENVKGLEGYEAGVTYYAPTKYVLEIEDGEWKFGELLEAREVYINED